MFTIGILCSQRELAETVEQTVSLLAVRAGMDYMVKDIHKQNSSLQDLDDLSCLILSLEKMEQAFAQAELLWKTAPTLAVIYVAHSVEELSASLQQPFFHIVRTYHLEQDLEAALRKLGRWRLPVAEKVSFTGSKGIFLVRRNEILYLESQHHDIWLHMEVIRSMEAVRSMEVVRPGETSVSVNRDRGRAENRAAADDKEASAVMRQGDFRETPKTMRSHEVISVNETLAQCEEKLKSRGFVRIHRSFLVNMYHIRHMDKDSVVLDNGERLYISRHRYAEVKLRFENYIRHLDFLQ